MNKLSNIEKIINYKLLKIFYNIEEYEDIIKYIDKDINKNIIRINNINNNVNIKNEINYLLNNDANFLIVHKSLESIKIFIEKKYKTKIEVDEINDIIIEYLSR